MIHSKNTMMRFISNIFCAQAVFPEFFTSEFLFFVISDVFFFLGRSFLHRNSCFLPFPMFLFSVKEF